MKDPRHPRQYPKGDPLMTTPEWKQLVRSRIESNKRDGRAPSSVKELARLLKADPSGIYRMLDGGQPTSKYAPRICEILDIQPGMVVNPVVIEAIGDDEFERLVDRMRRLSPGRKKRALAVVLNLLDGLDEK